MTSRICFASVHPSSRPTALALGKRFSGSGTTDRYRTPSPPRSASPTRTEPRSRECSVWLPARASNQILPRLGLLPPPLLILFSKDLLTPKNQVARRDQSLPTGGDTFPPRRSGELPVRRFGKRS